MTSLTLPRHQSKYKQQLLSNSEPVYIDVLFGYTQKKNRIHSSSWELNSILTGKNKAEINSLTLKKKKKKGTSQGSRWSLAISTVSTQSLLFRRYPNHIFASAWVTSDQHFQSSHVTQLLPSSTQVKHSPASQVPPSQGAGCKQGSYHLPALLSITRLHTSVTTYPQGSWHTIRSQFKLGKRVYKYIYFFFTGIQARQTQNLISQRSHCIVSLNPCSQHAQCCTFYLSNPLTLKSRYYS